MSRYSALKKRYNEVLSKSIKPLSFCPFSIEFFRVLVCPPVMFHLPVCDLSPARGELSDYWPVDKRLLACEWEVTGGHFYCRSVVV
jgi:hypothetical protein